MIVGHYAAALLPYSRLRQALVPLWLLLLCANLPEFLWLALALSGHEAPTPGSFIDASLSNLRVDMLYSHDLVPALLQGVLAAGLVAVIWSRRAALWCGGLVVFHVLCDYVVGFEHHVLGPQTPEVALNTYGRAAWLAVAIELLFVLLAIHAYQKSEASFGRPVPAKRLRNIYLVFVIGVLLFLPAAFGPLSDFL